jgi:hypothetical protein
MNVNVHQHTGALLSDSCWALQLVFELIAVACCSCLLVALLLPSLPAVFLWRFGYEKGVPVGRECHVAEDVVTGAAGEVEFAAGPAE